MKKLIYTVLAVCVVCVAVADDHVIQFVVNGHHYSYRTSDIKSITYDYHDEGSMMALDQKRSIRLSADDGTDVLLSLSRSLNIRFDNTNLIVSDNEQTITISLDNVKIEYSTDKAPTGIADVQEARGYTIGDGTVTFQGLKAGQTVRVFSVDGKLLMTVPANGDGGKTCVELSALPAGVCIIQAGKYSLKYSRN